MNQNELTTLHGAETVMKAHCYLYYVKNTPVLLDYEYDKWCSQNDLFGGGGSDREQDYSLKEKRIAEEIYNPSHR